ncbi:hypothetical protein [Mycobacterium kansasii]|uniref:hypothetical protein n=1 Tax=Mycobacterium kansasii TaxID=1768 RepID=UPI000F174CBA|nr:hypothetical protein [Mycobacterium kansasii]VAZ63164.1 hypothetical protein LAUMK22_04996 [Mycobacterium kansasii]
MSARLPRMPRHNVFVLESWPVVSVDDWSLAGLETQGQHPHDWLKHPGEKRTWLFKPARPERDRSLGEDVAEKLASELARLVGIPAARVELAVRDGVHGALIEDVRLPNWELQAGQALMPEVLPSYDPDDPGQCGHNVRTIQQALTRFATPPGSALPSTFRAFDAFAGYLVFDALIAHGDRHDRNWAVLVPPPETDESEALCPSFDHAASLGFTLTDETRAQHLRDGTVPRWASRGKAYRFEHGRGTRWQTLVELAHSATALCESTTRDYWRERIMAVDTDSVARVVAAAPAMSEIARRFTVEFIMINRGRLLDVLS